MLRGFVYRVALAWGCASVFGCASGPTAADVAKAEYRTCATNASHLEADPSARQLALDRCERQFARRLDVIGGKGTAAYAGVAQEAQLRGDASRRLQEIRANPRAPELGATVVEAKNICESQSGILRLKGSAMRCIVPNATIFVGRTADRRVTTIVRMFEGADPVILRDQVVATYGNFDEETLTQAGYRRWRWDLPHGAIEVAGAPHGALVADYSERVNERPEPQSP